MEKTTPGYNFSERESFWQSFWEEQKVGEFDPTSTKPVFDIDTPPPTVSGSLHLGHVFSYTQAEVIARFKRMDGFNVRYPFGLDDNGLPTERLVEKEKGVRGKDMPLADFVAICLEVTKEYRKKFEDLWKSLGFSFDWRLEYSTISPEVQKISQQAFIDLYKKDKIYREEAPALYCPECQTTVAQAEVEDADKNSVFYDIAFKAGNEDLIIATTRPELLPACVAVFVNPEDKRYAKYVGKMATTPLGVEVPILSDSAVAIDKGTGVVMCCTYGDEQDVKWVREHKLPEKIIIDKAGKIDGLYISKARTEMVNHLKELGVVKKEVAITHAVGTHERCGTPIEILPVTQWFVKIIEMKPRLLEAGSQINWYPAHMQKRFEDWVTNLKWDWNISRERFFGVPIPAYVCESCNEVMLVDEKLLPIDPKVESVSDPCAKCGGKLIPEKNVLDTWFTSSQTPEINNQHALNGALTGKLHPMSMRPQAHDIIRTWAVYTILMNLYRYDEVPWKDLMISGHVLLRKGEKISKKAGGGGMIPEELIAMHSADAIRYTVCGAGLGKDAYYEEKEVQNGKKLVTKLYNACKFVLNAISDVDIVSDAELLPLDRWIIARMQQTAERMKQEFDKYEYSLALNIFEEFFWGDFTDNYLEIVKGRIYSDDMDAKSSAAKAITEVWLGILKMVAPFAPHIAEELYHADLVMRDEKPELESSPDSGFMQKIVGTRSIHLTDWPKISEPLDEKLSLGAKLMLQAISEMRKHKAASNIRLGEEMGTIVISMSAENAQAFKGFDDDFKNVARSKEIIIATDEVEVPEHALEITL